MPQRLSKIRLSIYLAISSVAASIFTFASSFNLSNKPKVSLSIFQLVQITGDYEYYFNSLIFGGIIFVGLFFIFEKQAPKS